MALRVRDGLEPTFGGIAVFDCVAERVRLACQVAERVVGIARHVAEGVGHAGEVVRCVVVIARGVPQRVSHGGHAADGVILVSGRIALRVGLGDHVAREVVLRRQRRAVGIADLPEQAVHRVAVVCRIAERVHGLDRVAERVVFDLGTSAVRCDRSGRSRR